MNDTTGAPEGASSAPMGKEQASRLATLAGTPAIAAVGRAVFHVAVGIALALTLGLIFNWVMLALKWQIIKDMPTARAIGVVLGFGVVMPLVYLAWGARYGYRTAVATLWRSQAGALIGLIAQRLVHHLPTLPGASLLARAHGAMAGLPGPARSVARFALGRLPFAEVLEPVVAVVALTPGNEAAVAQQLQAQLAARVGARSLAPSLWPLLAVVGANLMLYWALGLLG